MQMSKTCIADIIQFNDIEIYVLIIMCKVTIIYDQMANEIIIITHLLIR